MFIEHASNNMLADRSVQLSLANKYHKASNLIENVLAAA